VERNDETGNSEHYALSDFKTADGVRKGEDYINNYFVSRYGAIKDIDFSGDTFANAVCQIRSVLKV